jgi:competence protein ComEA
MIRNFLINYFGFNRQQRNGLLVLLGAIFLLFIARMSMPYIIKPDEITIKNIPLALMDSVGNNNTDNTKPFNAETKTTLFKFDPNTVNQEELRKLGLSEKQAASFIRFRNKGFVFYKKEDLKKVFVISDKLYERISPYVDINNTTITTQEPESMKAAPLRESVIIELNSADSIAFISLPGIGPAYAKRILKYRSLLGGFTSIDQLKEVYGFSPESFDKVKDHIRTDPTLIKKVDLNKDEFKIITRHPYIGYERTKEIFSFRKKQPITAENLSELFPIESERVRLLPYLDLGM